jgi:hypothetical protein
MAVLDADDGRAVENLFAQPRREGFRQEVRAAPDGEALLPSLAVQELAQQVERGDRVGAVAELVGDAEP